MSNESNEFEAGKKGPPPRPGEDEEGAFGRMLEGSVRPRTFEEGEMVEGVVVAIRPDVAFLDIGGKSEAMIDIQELKDPEGDLEVEVGDRIQALVVAGESGLRLSRRLAQGAGARQQLADAYRAGLPVEGRVEKTIKGGYDVRIAGQRAFCPISQIDMVRTTDPAVHEGEIYTFRIVEYEEGGKNIVVSRRALLEEIQKEKAEEARAAIVPGAVLPGRVVSVRDYGAFVDLGAGVQGLLHVSEMAWARVANPAEVVNPGDEITVKVLRVDDSKGKISLGLKQLEPDPWSRAGEGYAIGQLLRGRITRVTDFGAFVELEPGVEALAHVSTFPPTGTPDGWKRVVPPGTDGVFEVLSLDLERKRIGVAMVEEGSVRAGGVPTAIVPGARLKGKVERHERFGVFVFLSPGRTGLIPLDETGTPRGADLKRAFPIGSEVEVIVLEVDAAGRRIRLSRKGVFEADERNDSRDYAQRQQRQAPESFGSLGEKLRSALGTREGEKG